MTQAFDRTKSNSYSGELTLAKRWRTIAATTLGLWIGGSLVLDLVVMPMLWATGMMESSGFASAGYSMFWVFNRVELVCAAIALSSILALAKIHPHSSYDRPELRAGAVVLLAIALSYTFVLTPYMSGLGIDLNYLSIAKSIPLEMDRLHSIYWVLEMSKIGIAGMLFAWCDR
jgi:hypothetical protein